MPTLVNKQVGRTGYGLMGLTWRAQPCPQSQAFEAMRSALKNGANFWNGGEFYGPPEANSLVLLRAYFSAYPEDAQKVVLSIKGGLKNMVPDGSAKNVRASVEKCLDQLGGKKTIDLFEMARVDTKVPLEETIGELGKLVQEGKIGGISLSEVNGSTIQKAAKIHPIAAVEVELSLWQTHIIDNGTAATCADLKIPLVAYSPLGRGFLTGQIKSLDDLPKDSHLRHFPRFYPENFERNLELLHKVEALAREKGCTPGQLALAWCRQISERPGMPTVIPIPGATTVARIEENMEIINLEGADLDQIDDILKSVSISGARYMPQGMLLCDQ